MKNYLRDGGKATLAGLDNVPVTELESEPPFLRVTLGMLIGVGELGVERVSLGDSFQMSVADIVLCVRVDREIRECQDFK